MFSSGPFFLHSLNPNRFSSPESRLRFAARNRRDENFCWSSFLVCLFCTASLRLLACFCGDGQQQHWQLGHETFCFSPFPPRQRGRKKARASGEPIHSSNEDTKIEFGRRSRYSVTRRLFSFISSRLLLHRLRARTFESRPSRRRQLLARRRANPAVPTASIRSRSVGANTHSSLTAAAEFPL